MILTKLGQHVNEMMAVAVKNFLNFCWSRFLIIRQNVNMATNAILCCGLPSAADKSVNMPVSTLIKLYGNRC